MRDYLSGSQHGLFPYVLIKVFYQTDSNLPGFLISKQPTVCGDHSFSPTLSVLGKAKKVVDRALYGNGP